MKHLPHYLVILILAWSGMEVSSVWAVSTQVIFDNTINPSSTSFGPGCCQVGNEITFGENGREIIQLSWLIDSQNFDVVGGIDTHIYVNDAPGGAPGTLLWQSGLLTGINVFGTDTFLDVAVPNIVVPDTITVTSRILDSVPVALGRVNGGSPSVGSVNTSWVKGSSGVWFQQFGPYGLRVTSTAGALVPSPVPEPVTAALGLMGLGVLGMTTRRRVA